jgi:diadenosine tetraphosphate (Ap4A) HIT family hydrolase
VTPDEDGCRVCEFTLRLPVAAMVVSDVGLYDDARYLGRLLVSAHEHYDHLDEMPDGVLVAFMRDVRAAMAALRGFDQVERVNLAILGNGDRHVHAHLIPRRPGEPNVGRAPRDGAGPHGFLEPSARAILMARLANTLAR